MFTFITFLLFTGLVGLLTWLMTRHRELDTADGYFLAGRSLGAGVIAGSLLLTNLSTEQLVGLNGSAFQDGLSVMAWEVIAGLSLVVMAIFFLPRYLARGITTIPEFLAGRFDPTTQAITNAIFILAYMLILLPIILYSGAMGLKEILDLSALTGIESDAALLWLTVWVIGVIGSIYAIFGGLRSVAISDTLNGFGLLVGGTMISYLGLRLIGDGSMWAGLETLRTANPEKFRSLGDHGSSVPWPTLFSGVLLLNLFYWTTNQQIIQRTFAAKTLAHGQRGVLLAACFKILSPLILVLPGIIAFHLFVTSPETVAVVEGAAVAEQTATRPDEAYGRLVKLVLPDAFTGFFAAVMVGAILSSFNSALNATATLFSLGVYRTHLHPGASDHQTVRAGRWFGTAIAIGAMLTAPMLAGQESIFGYLQKMNGLYFIPIFAVVLMGMFTRRTPALAANVALIVGVVAIAVGYFVPGPAGWLAATMHEFHFLGLVFVSLIALMGAVALVAPAPSAEGASRSTRELQEDRPAVAGRAPEASSNPYRTPEPLEPLEGERGLGADRSRASERAPATPPPLDMTPWPYAKPAGIVLAAIVLGIYLWFAF
ncbi:solute:sodium symporter family transporter [Candidatus Laterigemmans baculatus]|uniref:solute:sodium symporter family transporter n=1 Tax=Candidatus Laterigemmans baculatus TaxID=2770505 RepID=UPI0013DC2158|nr:solute:sodium symporter family transporter [Candidatus Laterigemmans baculatus]